MARVRASNGEVKSLAPSQLGLTFDDAGRLVEVAAYTTVASLALNALLAGKDRPAGERKKRREIISAVTVIGGLSYGTAMMDLKPEGGAGQGLLSVGVPVGLSAIGYHAVRQETKRQAKKNRVWETAGLPLSIGAGVAGLVVGSSVVGGTYLSGVDIEGILANLVASGVGTYLGNMGSEMITVPRKT
jgi:hypothetical protein